MLEWMKDNSLILFLCVATGFTVWWLQKHKTGLRMSAVAAHILALLHTLIGVLCVKIFAVLETLDFSSIQGTSLFGAIFFLPLVYWGGGKLTKRNIADIFDVFTPCVVFTLMCARVNCIIAGCCLGQYIPGLAPLRWPTREIEVVFYILLLGWFIYRDGKEKQPGTWFPLYMICYGGVRFVLEFFREANTASFFHLSHLWAVICLGLGLSFYIEVKSVSNVRGGSKK